MTTLKATHAISITQRKDVSMLTPVPTTRRHRRVAADGPHIPLQASPSSLDDDLTGEFEPVTSANSVRDVAENLRRSTLRAHHALNDATTAPETLRDIRAEVAELEDEIDRLGLRKLRPFLGSLLRRIEASL